MSRKIRFTPEMRLSVLTVAAATGLFLDAIQPDENPVPERKPDHSVRQAMSHDESLETFHHIGPEQTFSHIEPEQTFSHIEPKTILSHIGPEQTIHHVADQTPVRTTSLVSETVQTKRVVIRAAEIPFVDTPEQALTRSHQQMTDDIVTMESDFESVRAAMVTANEIMSSMNLGKLPGTTAGNTDFLSKSPEEQQELDEMIDAGMRIFNDNLVMDYLDAVQARISGDVDQVILNHVIATVRREMAEMNESHDVTHIDITSDQYIEFVVRETNGRFTDILSRAGVDPEHVAKVADEVGPQVRKIINTAHDADLVDKFLFGLEHVFTRIDAFGMSEINTAVKNQVAAVNDKARESAGDLPDETILGNIAVGFVDVLESKGFHAETDIGIRDLAEDRVARLLAGFNPFLDEYDYPAAETEGMLEVAEMDASLDMH